MSQKEGGQKEGLFFKGKMLIRHREGESFGHEKRLKGFFALCKAQVPLGSW